MPFFLKCASIRLMNGSDIINGMKLAAGRNLNRCGMEANCSKKLLIFFENFLFNGSEVRKMDKNAKERPAVSISQFFLDFSSPNCFLKLPY